MAILRNTTAITATFEGSATATNSVPRGTALSATLSVLESDGTASDLSDFTSLTLEVRPYATSSVALVQDTLASGSFTDAPTLPAVHATFELTDTETNIAIGDVASADLHLVIHGVASAGKVTIATGTITWTNDGAGTSDTPAANPAVYYTAAETDAAISSAPGGATPEGTSILSTGVTDGYVLTADGAGAAAWEASAGGGAGDEWGDVVDADIIPDADGTRDLGATATRFAETYTDALDVTNNITVGGTVDGRDIAADGTTLDLIEASATADQTDAEIRAAVEAATDSNVFTDADHTKLDGIETAATADQTDAEIRTAVEAATDSNVFTDADHSKLDGVAASANNYSHPNHTGDVTSTGDGATVIAAGVVDPAMMSATGTPDGTTFLRGDNTWAAPSGSGDMVLATVQTVTGAKTFGTIGGAVGKLILAGSTSGSTILNAAATAGAGTVTLPTTGTLLADGGALGTPSSGTLTNATGLPQAGTVGLTTADSPQFTGIELGHATDTTLTRSAAGVLAVEGAKVEMVQRYRDFSIPAGAWRPLDGNTATATSVTYGTHELDVMSFDASGGDTWYTQLQLPEDYLDGAVLRWRVFWDAAATASGTAQFGLSGGAFDDSLALSTALGTPRTLTDTLLTVGDLHKSPNDGTGITLAGTPVAGDFIVLELTGDAAGTIAVDTYALNVQIQYQTGTTTPSVWS